jgi:hypothetical protein
VLLALAAGGCGNEGHDSDSFVQREESRLIKVQSVGLAAFGPINPNTATARLTSSAFGSPSSTELSGGRCTRSWRQLGLKVEFIAPEHQEDPCGDAARIAGLRVAGAAARLADWRTAEGIRPGMSVKAMRAIYPDGRTERQGRVVLVDLLEPEAGAGSSQPVLVARTHRGRVRAMIFPIRTGGY